MNYAHLLFLIVRTFINVDIWNLERALLNDCFRFAAFFWHIDYWRSFTISQAFTKCYIILVMQYQTANTTQDIHKVFQCNKSQIWFRDSAPLSLRSKTPTGQYSAIAPANSLRAVPRCVYIVDSYTDSPMNNVGLENMCCRQTQVNPINTPKRPSSRRGIKVDAVCTYILRVSTRVKLYSPGEVALLLEPTDIEILSQSIRRFRVSHLMSVGQIDSPKVFATILNWNM